MQNVWVLAKSSTHPWRKVFLFQFMQVGILIKLEKQEQIGDSIINLSSLVGHSYNIWIYVSIFDFLASKRISNSILNDMNYIERTFSHSRHLSRYTFRRIYHRLLTLHPIWHHLCWYTTIYLQFDFSLFNNVLLISLDIYAWYI